ncbi:MAG: tRNA (adenosine(37)-N6)-dimethylallyltransferase MiaA [bacterium]
MKTPLLVIVGPTAAGKTNTAIEIAAKLSGEVISADSRQIYRYMDIGTAKPSLAERKGIPHYLIDIVDPDADFSVANFQPMAQKIINQIWEKGKLPMLVGGTGLYISAVIDAYNFSNLPANPEFRHQMRKLALDKGKHYIWHKLQSIDPVTAERLHPNDVKRIIRALEVYNFTGRTLGSWEQEQPQESPYNLLIIGITRERSHLYEAINRRVDKMMEMGLIEEVHRLLKMGYSPTLNSMQGLGYKELIPYINGEISLAEAVEILKRDTRRFAKRQLTWFRRDKRVNWFVVESEREADIVEEISKLTAGKLNLLANRI